MDIFCAKLLRNSPFGCEDGGHALLKLSDCGCVHRKATSRMRCGPLLPSPARRIFGRLFSSGRPPWFSKQRSAAQVSAFTFVILGLSNVSIAAPREAPGHVAPAQSAFPTENLINLADKRITELKADLKLTPVQRDLWPAVETALRDQSIAFVIREEAVHKAAKDAHSRADLIEGLTLESKNLAECAMEKAKLAEVAKPLYDSLTDMQKQRFGPRLKFAAGARCY